MMSDDEIDERTIIRKKVNEEILEPGATRWRLTFDDGLVAETIMIRSARGEESHWEVRIVEPYQGHLRTQFANHNAAYRFIIRDHIE